MPDYRREEVIFKPCGGAQPHGYKSAEKICALKAASAGDRNAVLQKNTRAADGNAVGGKDPISHRLREASVSADPRQGPRPPGIRFKRIKPLLLD